MTFDDGPGPRTAELLTVLARHGARATFFVTAPAVQTHAAQLQALRSAGHQFEAHGRWHIHALLLPPWREWRQVRWHPRTQEPGPHFYRPHTEGIAPGRGCLRAFRAGRSRCGMSRDGTGPAATLLGLPGRLWRVCALAA
ncbi:polysaccharide deacetylase family protein [Deinococcus malanensis]|uniref:polysaccharide deacetylase family protein n=1 Tax=Deinococcus malanensis TaxID=1706855 RepID=UPI003626090B